MFVVCKEIRLRTTCYTYLCGGIWGSIHKTTKYATQDEAEAAIRQSAPFELPYSFLLLDEIEYFGVTYNRLVYRFY